MVAYLAEKTAEKGAEKAAEQKTTDQKVADKAQEPKADEKAKEGTQEALTPLDQEELEIYQMEDKAKVDFPKSIVIRTDVSTGAKAMMLPKEELAPGAMIKDSDCRDLEVFDGSSMEQMPIISYLDSRRDFRSYRWHHNRDHRFSFRHRYSDRHPYASYYGHRYGPVHRYGYYYDRPYRFERRIYRPYYSYWLGRSIYNFFREVID